MRLPTLDLGSMRLIGKALVLAMLSVMLPACNTWSGFGKDLQHLGKSIEGRAKESPSTDK
jgi:predicted small secreted protein